MRAMFKGTEPTKIYSAGVSYRYFADKERKTQSALNNFDEFTMLDEE